MLLALFSLLLVALPLASADPTGSVFFTERFATCVPGEDVNIPHFVVPAGSTCSETLYVSPSRALRLVNGRSNVYRTIDLPVNSQELTFEFWLRYAESVIISRYVHRSMFVHDHSHSLLFVSHVCLLTIVAIPLSHSRPLATH